MRLIIVGVDALNVNVIERLDADAKQKLLDDRITTVSDHGFERGTHTHTGFYSCSHIVKPKPVSITYFFELIRKLLEGRASLGNELEDKVSEQKN